MAFEDFLDHLCNIYHDREAQVTPGYGLPASPSFSYPEEPDIKKQACHFGVKPANVTTTQTAPANLLEAKTKLTLPIGTDVRINDKIVDCATRLEYTAEQPVNVRNHHIFVYIKRNTGQEAL